MFMTFILLFAQSIHTFFLNTETLLNQLLHTEETSVIILTEISHVL